MKRYVLEFPDGEKWYFYSEKQLVEECFARKLKRKKCKLIIEE